MKEKRVIKKVLLIAIVMILQLQNFICADTISTSFTDVKSSDWFYDNLQSAVDLNIINGYPDGTFRPLGILKFEEFIKMLMIACDPDEEYVNNDGDKWYQCYLDMAYEKDYITRKMFDMAGTKISRATMSEISYNVLREKEILQNVTDKEVDFFTTEYADVTKYDTELMQMMKLGILTGYPDKTFKADGYLKRQEVVAVILRLIDKDMRMPVEIVIPKDLEDFDEPDLEYLYKLPCHVGNRSYTVDELNLKFSIHNDKDDLTDAATDFMNSIFNIDYETINTNKMRNSLIYYLHQSVEYNNKTYEYLTDENPITEDTLFDMFLTQYFNDIDDNKFKIQGKFYTENGLCIFVHDQLSSRGILRFKIDSAKDLDIAKEILFIRDTKREQRDNRNDELFYGGYDNSRYIKNSDINLKLNTWYELAVDVIMTKTAKTGSYVYQNYDTSYCRFRYMCPLYIKELK